MELVRLRIDPKAGALIKQVYQIRIGCEPHLRAFGDFGRDIHFYDEGLAGIRVQMHQSVFAQLLNQIQSAANDGIFFRAGGQMFRPKTNIGIDPREPPPLKWSAPIVRKRRTINGHQETQA